MPPRREHRWEDDLGLDGRIIVRWETERDVVSFAVTLLARVGDAWRTVVLFDCSHDDRNDRNDRHRYTFGGVKGVAERFHHGTPGEAMRDAIDLITTDYRRMEDDRAMADVRAPRRSAARLATNRVTNAYIEASISGDELPFPNGSSVIPSDLVTAERIREAHAHGRTVAIVDEHENVTVLPAPDPSLGEREWDRFWSRILTHW